MAENEVPIHLEMAMDLVRLLESECIFDHQLVGVAIWLRVQIAIEFAGNIMRNLSTEHAHG